MPGSCTHISSDTAKDQCKWVHGISKRKEQSFDIPEIWEHEVRILKQRILVSRVLCRYSRKEYESHQDSRKIHVLCELKLHNVT